MVWLKGLAVAAVLAVNLGGTPVFAQSGGDTVQAEPSVGQEVGEHDEKGLPQLNTKTFASQIFWLVVTFGALYVLVSKVGLPRVGAVLEAREAKISGDLDKAVQLKAETDAIVAAYEKAVAEARADAHKLLNETAATADAAAAKRTADVAAGLAVKQKEAEARIEGQKQTALSNVRTLAAEAASAAVAKLAGVEPEQGNVDGAVDAALKEHA
ncbi:MAG: ATPase [Azospirillaceae bacterium]|nr:ATPase [Azospirillaceae bacterium]